MNQNANIYGTLQFANSQTTAWLTSQANSVSVSGSASTQAQVTGNGVIASSVLVSGNTRFGSTNNLIYITKGLEVDSTAILQISGDVTLNQNANIYGTVQLTNSAQLTSQANSVSVSGSVSTQAQLTGNGVIASNVYFLGNTRVGSTNNLIYITKGLEVDSTATLQVTGNVTANKVANIYGSVQFADSQTMAWLASQANLVNVSGSVSTQAQVTGNGGIDGSVYFSGNTLVGSTNNLIHITNNLEVDSTATLQVGGNVTMEEVANIYGTVQFANSQATAWLTSKAKSVNVSGTVSTQAQVTGNGGIGGSVYFSGNTLVGSTNSLIYVTNNLEVDSTATLQVAGNVTMNEVANIYGTVQFADAETTVWLTSQANSVSFSGSTSTQAQVIGNAGIAASVYFYGNTSAGSSNKLIYITNNLQVDSSATLQLAGNVTSGKIALIHGTVQFGDSVNTTWLTSQAGSVNVSGSTAVQAQVVGSGAINGTVYFSGNASVGSSNSHIFISNVLDVDTTATLQLSGNVTTGQISRIHGTVSFGDSQTAARLTSQAGSVNVTGSTTMQARIIGNGVIDGDVYFSGNTLAGSANNSILISNNIQVTPTASFQVAGNVTAGKVVSINGPVQFITTKATTWLIGSNSVNISSNNTSTLVVGGNGGFDAVVYVSGNVSFGTQDYLATLAVSQGLQVNPMANVQLAGNLTVQGAAQVSGSLKLVGQITTPAARTSWLISPSTSVNFTGTLGSPARLTGNGGIAADVFCDGNVTLQAGNSPGTIYVAGNLAMSSTTTMELDVASADVYDKYVITKGFKRDGILYVHFEDGYVPDSGVQFTFATHANSSGSFALTHGDYDGTFNKVKPHYTDTSTYFDYDNGASNNVITSVSFTVMILSCLFVLSVL
jgi:carbonic anhydrase/acetyltransferase-like protein (isoleucine patch superfamily)